MLRLSKKADYALIAMNHLARKQGTASASTSARDIAERYDIPIELMAKVLQRLVRTGLLISTQGTRGGYMLSRPSGSISVADVIQAIDGPFTVTACSSERHDCEQYSKCNVRGPLWQIRERIVATLGTVSIAEMAADSEPVPAAAELAVVRRSGVSGSAGHGPRQG
jgi:Rrf2 family protein